MSTAEVRATFVSFTEVHLEWTLPPDVAGVSLYRVTVRNDGAIIGSLDTLEESVSVEELDPETDYRFTVGSNATTVTVGTDVTTCPAYSVTASPDRAGCEATAGYFLDINGVIRSCAEFEGIIDPSSCLDPGLTARDIELLPGHWRANTSTTEFFRCPEEQFCMPDVFGGEGEENATGTNVYCSPDHTGTFCFQCIDDLVLYDTGCQACDEGEDVQDFTGLIVASVVYVFVLGLLTAYMVSFMGGPLCGWCANGPASGSPRRVRRGPRKGQFDDSDDESQAEPERRIVPVDSGEGTIAALLRRSAAVKLRIVAGFFQVLLVYEFNFQKQQRSEFFAALLDTLSFLCNLDFTVIFDGLGFRCAYDYRYYEFLVFVTALPPTLVLSVLIVGLLLVLCLSGNRYALGLGFISSMLVVMFLVYPFVCVAIFNTFVCQTFPGAQGDSNFASALRADYSVDCAAADRQTWVIYAGIMSAVYALGVICVYILCTVFYPPLEGSRQGPLPFLTSPYRRGAYWFETYELVRKLLTTSLIILLQLIPSSYQTEVLLLSAQNVNILAIVVLSYVSPYRDTTDFWLALISLILLVPLIQYSFIDPYGDTLTDVVEVIVYIELVLLVLFIPLGACLHRTRPGFMTRKEAHEVESKLSAASAAGEDDGAQKQLYKVGIPPNQPQASKLDVLQAEREELQHYKSENDVLKANLQKLKASQSSPFLPGDPSLYQREKHISEMEAELKGSEARLLTAELEITEMERDVHKRQANVYKMLNDSLQQDVSLFQSENEVQSEELKFYEEENMRLKSKVGDVVDEEVEVEVEVDEPEAKVEEPEEEEDDSDSDEDSDSDDE